jgi:hypothetical protein
LNKLYFFITSLLLFFGHEFPAYSQFKNINSYVSQEQTVNGFSNTFLGVDFAEPYIATNPRDPLNTICSFIYGSYFTLDGLNWSRINSLNSVDPFLTFDSLGNAFYSPSPPWTEFNLSVRKSTDKGVTWQYNYQIYNSYSDRPCICGNKAGGIYSNYLYSGWCSHSLLFSRSTNQGVNWSPAILLNPNSNLVSPYIVVGPTSTTAGGILYYGYNSIFSNDSTYFINVRKSTDAGITFSSDILVTYFLHPDSLKNNSISVMPGIQMSSDNSYGPYRGNVYLVYSGKGIGNDLSDVFFTKSTNYGNNWSIPIRLNDDNTSNDQWMPAISVDNNGKIYVVWYDSRFDPQNYMTLLYGTVSTNGGASFVSDFPVSITPFNPAVNVNNWVGHYISVSAIQNTAIAAWYELRNGNYFSYVGYFPDFSMTVNRDTVYLGSNDSLTAVIKIQAYKGPYIGNEKFTFFLDSIPTQGNISINFLNRDSISTIPDSIYLKIKLNNVNIPRKHTITITGRNTSVGVPVHYRYIDLMVNSCFLNIGTNRNGSAQYKIDGITYNTQQNLIIQSGYHLVQAVSPGYSGSNMRYIFVNWSDSGDTTHNISVIARTNLTAYYKTQFKFILISSIENSFGQTGFYDSNQTITFGVLSKIKEYNSQIYYFKGWDGAGVGSYTSPDSTGNDTTVTLNIKGYIIENARWIASVGIKQITGEIPKEYKLYNNFPNPFNPVTKIKFDIPNSENRKWKIKNGLVSIKIYDVLGKEVATLVNENLQPGTYEILFSVNQFPNFPLPSGVYFYRLQAGDFIDTKKMLMIK